MGKVIYLTSGSRAKIEEKPEVRKAGGVYYTPTYIVDYIVKNTVGKLVEGKKPGPRGGVSKLRILDPACGSGSFLIGAYQYLLDWHRDQYIQDDPEKWAKGKTPRLYHSPSVGWRLTTDERKRILINNIFGVDIDPQAVEVTKLSLLLKVLEGEDEQSIGKQMTLFQERVLPDLTNNIKCGNSLIGLDFYDQQQMNVFDEEDIYKVNVFDWETEFAEVMKDGGFDVVIGNPPYVRQEGLRDSKAYFEKCFSVYHGIADLYVYFIEKGISLLKQGGLFSYIVANKWLRANYGRPLRLWLKEKNIFEIIDFGDQPVFKQAKTYPCILGIQKKAPDPTFRAVAIKTFDFKDLQTYINQNGYDVRQNTLNEDGWSLVDQYAQNLLDKLTKTGVPLGEYIDKKIYRGVLTGLNEAFIIDNATRERLITEDARSREIIKPFLAGRDIKRYMPLHNEKHLILFPRGFTNAKFSGNSGQWNWLKQQYPAIAAHLESFKEKAEKRHDKGDYWWELRACDYYGEFEKPKIMFPDISLRGNFALDDQGGRYCANTAYMIPNSEKYLLGILNSSLITFYYKNMLSKYRGGYLRFFYQYLVLLPIRVIEFNNPDDKIFHSQIVGLVDQMLNLNKKFAEAKIPQTKEALKRQIETTDKQIDQLVYQLYGLKDDEIKIVESEVQ